MGHHNLLPRQHPDHFDGPFQGKPGRTDTHRSPRRSFGCTDVFAASRCPALAAISNGSWSKAVTWTDAGQGALLGSRWAITTSWSAVRAAILLGHVRIRQVELGPATGQQRLFQRSEEGQRRTVKGSQVERFVRAFPEDTHGRLALAKAISTSTPARHTGPGRTG